VSEHPLGRTEYSPSSTIARRRSSAAVKQRMTSEPAAGLLTLRSAAGKWVVAAAVLGSGPEITCADLTEDFAEETFTGQIRSLAMLGEMERDAIARALEHSGGHQQRAADQLGISKRTLQRKIKSYGLVTERAVMVAR